MSGRRVLALASVVTWLVVLPVAVGAQTSFHAVVLDSSRAPIANAQVVAAPLAGGPSVTVVTDQHGEFLMTLPAGGFSVTISSEGFRPVILGVNSSRPSEAPREVVLQVAGFAETV